MGLEMEVISISRLFEAALILGSAWLPFNNNKNNKNQSPAQFNNNFREEKRDKILKFSLIT